MKWRIGVKMLGFKKTYILPFKFDIPNYAKEFLEKKSFIKLWIKFIKRYLYIHLKGQNSLEIYNILPEHKDILWINISAPSLGDSLTDLSSRIMLNGRVYVFSKPNILTPILHFTINHFRIDFI